MRTYILYELRLFGVSCTPNEGHGKVERAIAAAFAEDIAEGADYALILHQHTGACSPLACSHGINFKGHEVIEHKNDDYIQGMKGPSRKPFLSWMTAAFATGFLAASLTL